MTSETPNLHVSENLNISKPKQDIEKLKTPLRLVWKCCSVVFKIGSKIFLLQWHFKFQYERLNFATNLRTLERNLEYFGKSFVKSTVKPHLVSLFVSYFCLSKTQYNV